MAGNARASTDTPSNVTVVSHCRWRVSLSGTGEPPADPWQPRRPCELIAAVAGNDLDGRNHFGTRKMEGLKLLSFHNSLSTALVISVRSTRKCVGW